ncbi:MAG: hypothetical protein N2C12_17400, partial [Planctomycetales bacterium]
MPKSIGPRVSLVFSLSLAFMAFLTACDISGKPKSVAVYEDCVFEPGPFFIEIYTTTENGKKLAKVYVELPDQRRFLLSELPEEVAIQTLKGA